MIDSYRSADFSICPHCWHVDGLGSQVCVRCRADKATLLQESGGWRWTAPVQSPVPVRVGARLSRLQRGVILGFVVMLGLAQLAAMLAPDRVWTPVRAPVPGIPGGR